METKRTPVVEATITANELRLDFINGQSLVVNVDALDAAIARQAMLHGLKQKLVDAAAIGRDPETGRSATPDDKFTAVKTVFDRLMAGQWNATRGEGGGSRGGLLLEALCRLYPAKTRQELRGYLDGKTAKEQSALRKNPKVAAIIAEIQSANVDDSDDLLAELE